MPISKEEWDANGGKDPKDHIVWDSYEDYIASRTENPLTEVVFQYNSDVENPFLASKTTDPQRKANPFADFFFNYAKENSLSLKMKIIQLELV